MKKSRRKANKAKKIVSDSETALELLNRGQSVTAKEWPEKAKSVHSVGRRCGKVANRDEVEKAKEGKMNQREIQL